MTEQQLNEIRTAYENESPELGTLLKQAGFNESELNQLRDAYENMDDVTFGKIVKSKLNVEQPKPKTLSFSEQYQQNKQSGIAMPFVYSAIASDNLDALGNPTQDQNKIQFKKGDLIDKIESDVEYDENYLKNKWTQGNSWLATFPQGSYEVKKSMTDDPNVISQYMSQHNIPMSDMAYSMPRSAKNVIRKDVGELQGLAGVAGDVLSGAGRSLGSIFGNIGESDYLDKVTKSLGDIEGTQTFQNPVMQIAQGIARDPTMPLTVGTAGLMKEAVQIPKLLRTTPMASKLAPEVKQAVYGGLSGLGQTASTDLMNNYSQGKEGFGLANYTIGGLLGTAIPSAYKTTREFVPQSEFLNSQFIKAEPFKELQPNFGQALEDKAIVLQKSSISGYDPRDMSQNFEQIVATTPKFKSMSDLYHSAPVQGEDLVIPNDIERFKIGDNIDESYISTKNPTDYLEPNREFLRKASLGELLQPNQFVSRPAIMMNAIEERTADFLNKTVPKAVNPTLDFVNWLRQGVDYVDMLPVKGAKLASKAGLKFVESSPLRLSTDANVVIEWYNNLQDAQKEKLMNEYKKTHQK